MNNDSLFDSVPSRAVRVLRAKVAELEAVVTMDAITSTTDLAADIALVADILAEFIEWSGRDVE